MGTLDRGLRIAFAIAVAILFVTNQITGIAASILLTLAVIMALTSVVSFCPLYAPFKISTRKTDSKK